MPGLKKIVYFSFSSVLTILEIPFIILTFIFILTSGFFLIPIIRIFSDSWTTAVRKFNITGGRVLCASFWPFVRIKVEGKENLKNLNSYIIISNHTSFFDIAYNCMIPGLNRIIYAKTWVFKIPGIGPYMKWAGYQNTDIMDLEDNISEIKKYKNNIKLMLYPEGTRSRNGQIQRFRSGAFKISKETGFPIVPVHIKGGINFGHRDFPWLRPSKITMTILPPISPGDYPGETGHLKMRKEARRVLKVQAGEI